MEKNVTNEALDELKDALKEAGVLLDHLFNLEDDYPFLRDHLEEAEECVEESIDMKDDELGELREQLQDESCRVEELSFYFRALQEFCMNTEISLPGFLENGFSRLCEKTYRKPGPPLPNPEDDLLLKRNPKESLEEVLPW